MYKNFGQISLCIKQLYLFVFLISVHSSKNYQNKEDKVEEDDNNLYRLINVYTYLVSKHPNGTLFFYLKWVSCVYFVCVSIVDFNRFFNFKNYLNKVVLYFIFWIQKIIRFSFLLFLLVINDPDLPDLGQLLRDMQKIPNKLIGPYTENDCEVTIDLKAVHESFMERLVDCLTSRCILIIWMWFWEILYNLEFVVVLGHPNTC